MFNSSFEGCVGRYGGAALFICGGDIQDSTFKRNEGSGLFGAVVNGDLSDEDRLSASLPSGASSASGGDNYTCPPLSVHGTTFEENVAVSGYGGAIVSIDASLSVLNSTVSSTFGGGIYFGTSDENGRDQFEVCERERGRGLGLWVECVSQLCSLQFQAFPPPFANVMCFGVRGASFVSHITFLDFSQVAAGSSIISSVLSFGKKHFGTWQHAASQKQLLYCTTTTYHGR